jgi:ketosteroid isomerase-like protein
MNNRSLVALIVCIMITAFFTGTAVAETPEARIAAYHQALLDGDIEAAKGMLDKDLLLFEDGMAETSRKQYAGSHLKADIAFSAKAKRKLESQNSWVEGDTATVSCTYDVKTKYMGRSYHLKSAETMTLKQVDGQWVIVHIHWSNHQLKN